MTKKREDLQQETSQSDEGFLEFEDSLDISCIKIEYLGGNYSKYFPLGNKCTIGSIDSCDLEIVHTSIQSKHIAIKNKKDSVILHVYETEGHTSFNGKELAKGKNYVLKAGQSFRIGEFKITIENVMPLELEKNVERKLIFDGIEESKNEHLNSSFDKKKDNEEDFSIKNEEDISNQKGEVDLTRRLFSFVTDAALSFLITTLLSLVPSVGDLFYRLHYSLVNVLVEFGLSSEYEATLHRFPLLSTTIIVLFIVSLITHSILGKTIGQILLGLRINYVKKFTGQDVLRYLSGFIFSPFLIFDLPLVFGKKTFKEKITFTEIVSTSRSKPVDYLSILFVVVMYSAAGFLGVKRELFQEKQVVTNKKNDKISNAWVSLLKGKAFYQINGSSGKNELAKGKEILDETLISTGEKSRVVITFSNNTKINLGSNSQMLVSYNSESRRSLINLLKGQVRGYAKPAEDKNRLIISTKYTSVGVRGTEFLISISKLTDRVSVIGFSGETSVVSLLNPDLDTEIPSDNFLNLKLQDSDAKTVKSGRITIIEPSLLTLSKPIKISPRQYSALKNKDSLTLNIKNSGEDYKDGDNQFTVPRPGGYFDFETGLYVQPSKDSFYDKDLGVFTAQNTIGNVDNESGDYIPPSGFKLTKNGFEVVGYSGEEEKSLLANLNVNIYRSGDADIYKVFKYMNENFNVMIDNFRIWKEVDGLIGENVFTYAYKVNSLSSYLLKESKLDGSYAQLTIYDSLLMKKRKVDRYKESFPKELIKFVKSFGVLINENLTEDNADYLSQNALTNLSKLGIHYKTEVGENLIVEKLTYENGGAVKGCKDHESGNAFDVSSDKISFSKASYDQKAVSSLIKKSLSLGVKKIFYGDEELVEKIKNQFNDVEIYYSESHKDRIHFIF